MGLTKSASSSLYGTGLLSQARVPCFTPSASLIRTIYLSLYFASSSRAASLLRWRCAATVVALLLPVDNWVSGGSRYSLSSSSSATDETEQGPPVIQGSAPAAVCQSSKIGRDGRLEKEEFAMLGLPRLFLSFLRPPRRFFKPICLSRCPPPPELPHFPFVSYIVMLLVIPLDSESASW